MDHKEDEIRRDIEETRAAMSGKIELIEERVQETMEEAKSTVDSAMHGFKQIEETVEKAKSTADSIIESIKSTVDETIERAKYTSDLVAQVNQNPWIMFCTAALVGYILGSLPHEKSSNARHTSDRPTSHAGPGIPASPEQARR
jgi:ElaB/YqjD/DUF883 family membrane-anchored ribosome-binding protein